jgi:hypothetical protein
MAAPSSLPALLSLHPGRLATGRNELARYLYRRVISLSGCAMSQNAGQIFVAEKNLTYSSNPGYV